MQFPQTYRNDDGIEIVAINEIQASAFEQEGFKADDKPVRERKPRVQQ